MNKTHPGHQIQQILDRWKNDVDYFNQFSFNNCAGIFFHGINPEDTEIDEILEKLKMHSFEVFESDDPLLLELFHEIDESCKKLAAKYQDLFISSFLPTKIEGVEDRRDEIVDETEEEWELIYDRMTDYVEQRSMYHD